VLRLFMNCAHTLTSPDKRPSRLLRYRAEGDSMAQADGFIPRPNNFTR
jgi:hypothetical protein